MTGRIASRRDGSHYTRGVGDEKQARAALADMQARLARSPYDALNIQAGSVGVAEIRTAFLELTKTYHPAKFARMSVDIQRLANEVFLALRAAHDQLAKPKLAPPSTVRQSGMMPVLQRANDSGARLPIGQPARPSPPATPPQPPTRPSQPIPTVAPPRPHAVAGRSPTPAIGVPARPAASAAPPPTGPRAAVEPELAGVYELLQKQQWPAAHAAIAALLARAPQQPRYRALAHYARGREAQLARRLDDARVELHDALQLDPDLQIAKTALAELFTRRK